MNYLMAVRGMIGTGKSTVAQRICRGLEGVILSTDQIRGYKQNIGQPKAGYDDDIFLERQKVYDQMMGLSSKELGEGKTVVLDATFENKIWVDAARKVAREMNVPYFLIEVVCQNSEAHKKRLESRSKTDPTAATYEVFLGQREYYESVEAHFIVDSSPEKPLQNQIDQVVQSIKNKI